MSGCGARTAVGSLEAVFESSDVERFWARGLFVSNSGFTLDGLEAFTNVWVRGANGRRVSRGRFRVVGCGALPQRGILLPGTICASICGMWAKWQRSIYWRALEEARYTIGIAETGERAMILIVFTVAGIAVIWLMGERDIAKSELLIRSSEFVALVFLTFPIIYVCKLFTIPAKSFQIILGTGNPYETVEPSGVNRNRIVRVKLQNNTNTEINGKLHLLNLDPPNNGFKDFLLKDRITMGRQEHIYRCCGI
jgi:hypothetical protein